MNHDYWNSLAEDYSDQVLEIIDRDLNGVLEEEISVTADSFQKAADLGCGRGSLLEVLGENFAEVYAVDYAEGLLEKARRRVSRDNITFIRHNLASSRDLSFQVGVTFCVNAMISPQFKFRRNIARCVKRVTRKGGVSIFVVPAFESIFNTYDALLRCESREGKQRGRAAARLRRVFEKEVKCPVDGIVDIGGTLTKCYRKEELEGFLTEIGFEIERIRKVEFSWDEELDHPPEWLKSPYPWDWLVRARKVSS